MSDSSLLRSAPPVMMMLMPGEAASVRATFCALVTTVSSELSVMHSASRAMVEPLPMKIVAPS